MLIFHRSINCSLLEQWHYFDYLFLDLVLLCILNFSRQLVSYFPMYSAIMWLIYPSSIMTWCFNYALIYFYFQSAGCIVYVLLIIFSIYFIVYLVLYSIYYNLVVWCVLFMWIFPYMPFVLCIFAGASFFPWRHFKSRFLHNTPLQVLSMNNIRL